MRPGVLKINILLALLLHSKVIDIVKGKNHFNLCLSGLVVYSHGWLYLAGLMEISPSGVAPVCLVGDQLELTCSSSSGIEHRWEFTVFPENVTYTPRPITFLGASGIPTSPLTISTSTITFSRLSGQGSLPLVSRIVVSPVSSGLNGTVVNCFEGSTSTDSVAATTIYIIGGEYKQ